MVSGWLKYLALLGLLVVGGGCERSFFLEPGDETVIHGTIRWSHKSEKDDAAQKRVAQVEERLKGEGCRLNFGIGPWQSAELMVKSYRPLLEYLSQSLECTFILNISPDYDTLRRDLRDNNVQVALFAPNTYAAALEEAPENMRYIATAVKNVGGKIRDSYYGCFFALKSGGIRDLTDLRGKTFGFVEKGSTSGYSYPMVTLLKQKILPRTWFKRTLFLGAHDKVTDAVANGHIDAGVAWDSVYELAVEKHGDIFHLIQKTDPIPYDAWVVNTTVAEKLAKSLRDQLVGLTAETRSPRGDAVLGGHAPFTGFVVRGPEFYDGIREIKKLLRAHGEE